tara:strand:- start:167 stop:406 length:240 start_codon:yes stop_codon:yes gene_type:complete
VSELPDASKGYRGYIVNAHRRVFICNSKDLVEAGINYQAVSPSAEQAVGISIIWEDAEASNGFPPCAISLGFYEDPQFY